MCYLDNLFKKYRKIFILLYIASLYIVLFLFLAFFIFYIRNILLGFLLNNLDISLFTSIILVLPLIFFLTKIKRSFLTKFKYILVKKYDVENLCLQVSSISPTFASVAAFFTAYEHGTTKAENYDLYKDRFELFSSDLKKRFNIEWQEQGQPSTLVGRIGFRELNYEVNQNKEIIYRNLALASDIKKAGIATRCSPLITQTDRGIEIDHIFYEVYQSKVNVAYKAALTLQNKHLLLIAYSMTNRGNDFSKHSIWDLRYDY